MRSSGGMPLIWIVLNLRSSESCDFVDHEFCKLYAFWAKLRVYLRMAMVMNVMMATMST